MILSAGELGTHGVRHALDLLGLWVQISGVARVRIATSDPEVRELVETRLPYGVTSETSADMVLYPFSLEEQPTVFTAPFIAGCFRNRYSYRRLFHPGLPHRNLRWLCSEMDRFHYKVLDWRGIYPPAFLFYWTLSVLAGARNSELHFRLIEKADQNFAKRTEFSHLVAFYAKKNPNA
jgi:hypothetical protein